MRNVVGAISLVLVGFATILLVGCGEARPMEVRVLAGPDEDGPADPAKPIVGRTTDKDLFKAFDEQPLDLAIEPLDGSEALVPVRSIDASLELNVDLPVRLVSIDNQYYLEIDYRSVSAPSAVLYWGVYVGDRLSYRLQNGAGGVHGSAFPSGAVDVSTPIVIKVFGENRTILATTGPNTLQRIQSHGG